MKTKQYICYLLVVLLLCSLYGCIGDREETTQAEINVTAEPTETKPEYATDTETQNNETKGYIEETGIEETKETLTPSKTEEALLPSEPEKEDTTQPVDTDATIDIEVPEDGLGWG